ncbi:MAG TPA: cytidine deaminase [Lachnospiraceae bacterium]|nr:cytidine deaminase [Lachnospiraceae bacterium]
MKNEDLIKEAFEARRASYAPYSGFRVGAALINRDGRVVRGCNVENASYGLSNCAERTAVFKAVSEGLRDFEAIAIVGGTEEGDETLGFAYPCGACRQVLREFTIPETFKVIIARSVNDYEEYTLKELLPHSFGPDNL